MSELAGAFSARVTAALAWREGASIAPVLEALALSLALEVTGELPDVSLRARDELRRVGQRALLHVGGELGRLGEPAGDMAGAEDDGATEEEGAEEDAEDREEGLRIAVVLAREGLRALSGRPLEPEGGDGSDSELPTAREIARLLSGRAEPFEAASIARRIRGSERARRELAWAQRDRGEPTAPRVRLAAERSEAMRDPGLGRRIATIIDPQSGATIAEAFAFSEGTIAVYSELGEPVRLEGTALRTEAMQPGYWSGRFEGEGAIEGTLHVGDRALPFRSELA